MFLLGNAGGCMEPRSLKHGSRHFHIYLSRKFEKRTHCIHKHVHKITQLDMKS